MSMHIYKPELIQRYGYTNTNNCKIFDEKMPQILFGETTMNYICMIFDWTDIKNEFEVLLLCMFSALHI